MNASRWLRALLALVMAVGAPLASSTAMAQTSTPPPPPPPAAVPGPIHTEREAPSHGAEVGAKVLNVVYVPGKAILCGAGTVAGGLLMLLTFGNAYRPAVALFNEGCGGRWTLTPYDVIGKPTPDEGSY